ncbi:MAG: double zinc ribbon domain-containing protein, partial [Alphaproteobacteria bacterium]
MNIIKKIIDIIFPHLCLSCEKITTEDNFFCTDCLPKIKKIKDPKCSKCSLPFDNDVIKN